MAAGSDLRLQVILQAIDRATAPLKRISGEGSATAKTLRDTRDRLKELNAQQKAVGEFRELHKGLDATAAKLANAKNKAAAMAREMGQMGPPTKVATAQLAAAREAARSLAEQHTREAAKLQALRDRLNAAGISTSALATHEQRLRREVAATNTQLDAQQKKLAAQAAHAKRLADLKAQHGKAMTHMAMLGATGAAGIAAGRTVARPLQATVSAYAEQETASSQLRGSMMQADGSVSAEFAKINELANRLGDRLPGTTADFIEMMTMLRRQGLSAQSILNGTGEAAAYLGVQLQMPATDAAEFAAKMQDATGTVERDMMGLMDVIQRTFYLGVDANNMLQGITKVSAVMPYLGKKGLDATRMLAPMLVMMDQAGMKGEAAGNAIRKVVQMSMDAKKLGDANAMLAGTGVRLDFYDAKGKFAGFDNLFAQLQKLKTIESDVQRGAVMKKLFGDDAETHQVLNNLMEKGKAGYDEVVQKMQAQAELNKRVNEQLKTLANVREAAEGSFTNAMAAIGETIAPDLKGMADWLGNVAAGFRAWVAEHPGLVRVLALTAGAVAALYVVVGSLLVAFAGIAAPMLVSRFLLARLGIQGGMLSLTLGGLRLALAKTAAGAMWAAGAMRAGLVAALGATGTALRAVGTAAMWAGRMLLTTPIGWLIAGAVAVAAAAWWIYRNWGQVTAWLSGAWDAVRNRWAGAWAGIQAFMSQTWQALGGSVRAALGNISATLLNWSPLGLLYPAFAGVLRWFGFDLPQQFTQFGANLMQGLVGGITSRLGQVRDAITGAASGAIGWFKEKLGIKSPSRVFLAAGADVTAGAALGIAGGIATVRRAAAAMASAAAVTLPAAAAPPQAGALPAALAPVQVAMRQFPASPAVVERVQAAAPPRPTLQAPALPAALAPVQAAVQQLPAPAMAMTGTPTAAGPATLSLADLGAITVDARPPLAPPAARPAAAASDRIEIHIHPAAGSDPQAIARAVAAELDRRDRAKRSARLSALGDIS